LSWSYSGQLYPPGAEPGANQITADWVELNVDSFWHPVDPSFQRQFAYDLTVSGLGPGYLAASQGEVSRQDGRIHIKRQARALDMTLTAGRRVSEARVGALRVIARDPKGEAAEFFLRHGAEASAFFNAWFGETGGTLDTATIVIADRKVNSGYARGPYIVVHAGDPFEPSIGAAVFAAHEIAHKWWQGAPSGGEENWLNESFAEYVAWRYAREALGAAAEQDRLDNASGQLEEAGPVLAGARAGHAALYRKGPLLLHGLEQEIGTAAMDSLLAAFLTRERTTESFLALLAEREGAVAAEAFEARLRQ